MPELEITDVRLSTPQFDEPDLEAGERRAWTEVAISVRNPSPTTTYYVRADLCALQYDERSATLKAVLAEPPPNENIHATFLVQPHFMPVLPGTTEVIRDWIPVQMKGIDLSGDGPASVRTIDISGVRQVEVSLAHDTTPFRPVHTDPRLEIQKQLHSWGSRLEHAAECCLPAASAGEQPPIQSKRCPGGAGLNSGDQDAFTE